MICYTGGNQKIGENSGRTATQQESFCGEEYVMLYTSLNELEPVANMSEKCVTAEDMDLVQQAEDMAETLGSSCQADVCVTPFVVNSSTVTLARNKLSTLQEVGVKSAYILPLDLTYGISPDCDKMPASMIEMNQRYIIDFEEGWDFIKEGIKKVKRILEGQTESFSAEECMMLYTLVFNMSSQDRPHCHAGQLYDMYKEELDEYINSTVLPALREKQDAELMLRELVKRWENHKRMIKWLSLFFHYLSRRHIHRNSLPTLNEVGLTCFHNLVYQELSVKAINAVIVLIEKEREGEQIDRALLKNVLDIFVAIGRGGMEYYVNDFEAAMLRDTAAYYSRKASSWIVEDSYSDYMLRVEECLKKEEDRVSHYLHVSSETKLLEKVKNELLVVHANQLLEKEHSGSSALRRDDKAESSGSRMIP